MTDEDKAKKKAEAAQRIQDLLIHMGIIHGGLVLNIPATFEHPTLGQGDFDLGDLLRDINEIFPIIPEQKKTEERAG